MPFGRVEILAVTACALLISSFGRSCEGFKNDAMRNFHKQMVMTEIDTPKDRDE